MFVLLVPSFFADGKCVSRNALSSFLDLESQHNRMLEEKILLEQDLEGKRQLEEDMQRLKDDLRGKMTYSFGTKTSANNR